MPRPEKRHAQSENTYEMNGSQFEILEVIQWTTRRDASEAVHIMACASPARNADQHKQERHGRTLELAIPSNIQPQKTVPDCPMDLNCRKQTCRVTLLTVSFRVSWMPICLHSVV